jgi:L-2-hydroxyglutarate oxidase LhgO
MRFRGWGAHMSGILDGCNGVGHGMSNANSGVGHSMSKGVSWLPSVKSKVTSEQ